jgi:L-arabinose isomerase
MWIGGLMRLQKPIAHLHTQFNRDLPWESIDMDFMNLNQAAHGDREAGHLHARLGLARKVIVGHWSDPQVQTELQSWSRVAIGWHDLQGARFARFGDNMRQVAVTDGDKVAAEARFGFSVDGFGVGDLVAVIASVGDQDVRQLVDEYLDTYAVASELRPGGDRHESLLDAARQELGIREFLTNGGFKGFTTTFEDLHGLNQLPGLACQRLMADGFGFGAEGDWKTAALLRFAKVVDRGGGTSFMEDYTYHLDPSRPQVLGAHMLEICPTIASGKPKLEIHPLGIGGKDDPVRLVFHARPGPAVNASLIDLGHRFRLIVNEVEAVDAVARALWECKPNFKTAAAGWIYAGGAHHTVYSYALTQEHYRQFAEIAGIEVVVIDQETRLEAFRNELRWNEVYYHSRG